MVTTSASIDEVKNEWSFTSTPPTRLHDVDNIDFTFCDVILTVHRR